MYEILNSIIADYEKSCSMNDVFNSFLSVTGKIYNENLISRLVAYTLAQNKDSIRNLIDRYIYIQNVLYKIL